MNASQTQQTQTVTNVLSGEKSYRDVRFAITGVMQADLLSAIAAVIENLCGEPNLVADWFVLAAVFESLSKQYFEVDRRAKQSAEQWQKTQVVPSPFSNPPPIHKWGSTTSSNGIVDSEALRNEIQEAHDRWLAREVANYRVDPKDKPPS